MKIALEAAKKASALGEIPVGALIVDEKGQIVSIAHNEPIKTVDPTSHAEIVAIRKAAKRVGNYRLNGFTLYVTLEPCLMCFGAIIHARIKKVVFGALDPKSGALSSALNLANLLQAKSSNLKVFNHTVEITSGILASECGLLLKNFFESKRK